MATGDDEKPGTSRVYELFSDARPKKRKQPRKGGSDETVRSALRSPSPAKITREALHEAALRYLEKQDASVSQVRRALHRRIFRFGDEDTAPSAKSDVEQILERFVETKLLSDERYASGYLESQKRRGASFGKVRQKLRARGLSDEDIQGAVAKASEDETLSDAAACEVYARKRRLKERYDLSDAKERQKALAALLRQGFSFDDARRALGV